MKIQIIGYSGSGKSTLAKTLAQYYHIPLLYLDTVQFYGSFQERDKEEQNRIVREFLKMNDSWVIDGNYSSVAPERFRQADICIFLDFNRFFCYRCAKKRFKMYKGKVRESLGCEEKFDFEFKKWILYTGRTKKRKKQHLQNLESCLGEKYILKNRHQVNDFLFALRKNLPKDSENFCITGKK